MYKCRVCKKRFDNLMKHLHREESILDDKAFSLSSKDIKKNHIGEYEKIAKSLTYLGGIHKKKCFCGGEIKVYPKLCQEGKTAIICKRCNFLWDEK